MRHRTKQGTKNLFGKGIVHMRCHKGLSQSDLLLRIELRGETMTQTRLSRIEGGMTILTDRDLVIIASALEVSLDELLCMAQIDSPSNDAFEVL